MVHCPTKEKLQRKPQDWHSGGHGCSAHTRRPRWQKSDSGVQDKCKTRGKAEGVIEMDRGGMQAGSHLVNARRKAPCPWLFCLIGAWELGLQTYQEGSTAKIQTMRSNPTSGAAWGVTLSTTKDLLNRL